MLNNHTASLRALGEKNSILIGTAVNARALRTDYAYQELLAQEYNLLTPENEMKFGPLSPCPGAYDFGPADELVDFARANDMRVRGHTLVWHLQNPDWLKEGNYTRHQALDLLHRHIFTVMGHYRGDITAWDVVNEPMESGGGLRDSFWLHTIGQDYLEYAFRWAREADPGARLFLNEYAAEGLNEKSDGLYTLLGEMTRNGIPVDGVGLQMHLALGASPSFTLPPQVCDLFDNMKRLAELGLEIHITEMDVQVRGLDLSAEERCHKQAEVYQEVLCTALRCPQFKAFTTWGFTDRHSWIPHFTGNPDAPLPFDEYFQPKPAYEALYQALENR